MKTIITYITDDGKEFSDMFQARRHECKLTKHDWEYYDKKMNRQKEENSETGTRFCKFCSKQEALNKVLI